MSLTRWGKRSIGNGFEESTPARALHQQTDQVGTSAEGVAMVRAVVDLAAALGLETVAEGVEQQNQATALDALGCALAQGFLFARPAAAEATARALARLADVALA